MTAQILTQDYIKSLFEYKDGELYWKKSLSNRVKIGDKAGFLKTTKYLNVSINGKKHLNHRLIYIYHHGFAPPIIDHIDGNKTNNKIENLREATKSQNCKNGKLRKNNKSGIKNVYWYKRDQKWSVDLRVDGKLKNFGKFYDLNNAKIMADFVRNLYYGEYARKE